jgi:glutamyl-tRNA synthetase
MHELIKKFDLKKVHKAGARFSPEKAKWFNQQHLIYTHNEYLRHYFVPLLEEKKIAFDVLYLEKVIGLVKERMVLLIDFWEQAGFFFESPKEYNQKAVQKHFKENTITLLLQVYDILEAIRIDKFTTEHTEELIKSYIEDNELHFGSVLNPLRLVLTGTGGGPHLFDIVSTLGKEETLKRIMSGITAIHKI